jgi:hypothetical protein
MEFICPRGEKGYLEQRRKGSNVYYYAVHVSCGGGRRKVRKCYLGPKEYIAAERFNRLNLSGLADRDRFKRYILKLLDTLKLQILNGSLKKLRRGSKEKSEQLSQPRDSGSRFVESNFFKLCKRKIM